MPVGFLKSPRAASRIAAARAFLDRLEPGAPFLVLGHGRHAANRLAHEAAEDRAALFGAFRFGFRGLAAQLAGPELTARGAPAAYGRGEARHRGAGRPTGPAGPDGSDGSGRSPRVRGSRRVSPGPSTNSASPGVEEDAVAAEDPDLGTLYAAYREALAGGPARRPGRDPGSGPATDRDGPRGRRACPAGGASDGVPRCPAAGPRIEALRRRARRRGPGCPPDASRRGWGHRGRRPRVRSRPRCGARRSGRMPRRTTRVAAAQRHLFGSGRPDPAVPRRGLTVIAAPGTAAEARRDRAGLPVGSVEGRGLRPDGGAAARARRPGLRLPGSLRPRRDPGVFRGGRPAAPPGGTGVPRPPRLRRRRPLGGPVRGVPLARTNPGDAPPRRGARTGGRLPGGRRRRGGRTGLRAGAPLGAPHPRRGG